MGGDNLMAAILCVNQIQVMKLKILLLLFSCPNVINKKIQVSKDINEKIGKKAKVYIKPKEKLVKSASFFFSRQKRQKGQLEATESIQFKLSKNIF